MASSDPKREWLRHTLSAVAYGGFETIQNAPEILANFTDAGRTPGRIRAHMGDLLEWALFRGPIADALTHVGQWALLRPVAGASVGGENPFFAGVRMGRVGPEQDAAERVL
jgi:hypothetical protein